MLLDSKINATRLFLRSLDVNEVGERYFSWVTHPLVTQYLEIRHHPPRQIADLQIFVEKMRADPKNLLLGIFLQQNQIHIGNIKLGPIEPYHRRAEVGFFIGESAFWGQGYATEAITALSNYAFNQLGLRKLTAGCYEENTGSIKALEKSGFIQEANLVSHLILNERPVAKLVFAKFNSASE